MAAPDIGVGGFHGNPEAVRQVYQKLTTRTRQPVPEMVQRLADQQKLYIFNVSPWLFRKRLGTLGTFIIQPCAEGRPFSEPLTIPGLLFEPYPESENSDKVVTEEGKYVAEQIVGLGAHNSPINSLSRYGVAICHQWPPTKEEIEAARQALHNGELKSLIAEADSASAQGPKATEDTIRDRHHTAAKILKLSSADHPWMLRATQAASREECKFCGEPMRKGLARCPNCKEIVDQQLYDKLKGAKAAKE